MPLGRAFTYAVPDAVAVRRGSRVLVEFGRRRVLGVVLELDVALGELSADKVKPILALVESEPVIGDELLDFLIELGRYYLAPLGEVMRLALPAVERSAQQSLGRQGLLGAAKVSAVGRLVQVAVALEGALAEIPARGAARDLLARLRDRGPTSLGDLCAEWPSARGVVKRLVELGLVRVEQRAAARDPFFAEPAERDVPPELTPAQQVATDALRAGLDGARGGAFLLQGVTASGKTEVYLRAVGHALSLGLGAIVLVPEIALTPQLVARFRARLGDSIAVLHSGLTDGERHEMWRRLRSGELSVAVGARSALFAPLERLGLVCVDEEHDGSFKQEEGVRYNARDMALLRAHRAGAVCVLGSATPSLSSVALVHGGKMERLRLPDRAHRAAVLPRIEIVDLRRVGPAPGGNRLISVVLYRAIERVLAQKQQAILFLNRRGFSPSLQCQSCGQIVECPNCAVPLTLHRVPRVALRCHYCEHDAPPPLLCAKCASDQLVQEGAGTERIEATLAELFPAARIGRLDRDVAAGAKSARVLDAMRRGELDVLVGTQMVTKGHDLPGVTLVGVLNADSALSLPDFRAAERTFHLLVQVAGRAGRADTPGLVLIQTRQPEHPAIQLALRHDVDGFIEAELVDRKELRYPPYSRLALVRIDATHESHARAEAERLAAIARQAAPSGVDVLGPAPAPITRLRNRWRWRFLLRARDRSLLRPALLAVVRAEADRRVRVAVDVDPVSML